jgi:hypothetical protein
LGFGFRGRPVRHDAGQVNRAHFFNLIALAANWTDRFSGHAFTL